MKNRPTYTPFEQSLLNSIRESIVKHDAEKITIVSLINLPRSIPIFKGHFPGQPIFPAVLQLTFVRLLCAEITQKNLHNFFVGKTKFTAIIKPEEKIKIEIELTESINEYHAKFKFFNTERLASSGTVKYKVDN